MDERRQAFRRGPIEIDLGDRIVSIAPIPWEQRTDFGNEVISQHVQIVNDYVKLYADPDTGVPQLEAKLGEKFTDPRLLMELGLDDAVYQELKEAKLYSNQVIAILLAICEVNELNQLIPLIDPNLTTPTMLGGVLSELMSGQREDIQKTESGQDSSSPDSIESPSSNSPSPSLVPSSTSSPESPGTNETGDSH